MQENFKLELIEMIKNLQEKLHQGKRKQSKGAQICASIRWELECENAPKLSAKYLGEKIGKIKQTQNISVTRRSFLNQLKS